MLVQWRYKVCDKFARSDQGIIIASEKMHKIEHTKPRPDRVFLHKPTKRRYDYVDYTDNDGDVDVNYTTVILEFMGYIKFVEREKLE